MSNHKLRNLESRYLALFCAQRPVEASGLGVTAFEETLGSFDPDWLQDCERERRKILTDLQEIDGDALPMRARHDLMLLEADLERDGLLYEGDLHCRAPYIYPELAGRALQSALTAAGDGGGGEKLTGILSQVPGLFAQADRNLDFSRVPPAWCEMGMTAACGLESFLQNDLAAVAADLPDAHRLEDQLGEALRAVRQYCSILEDMRERVSGQFAVGTEHLESLLERYHLLPGVSCGDLYEFGQRQIEEAERRMHYYAEQIAPGRPWEEALDTLKDEHPEPEQLLDAYRAARDAALEHIVDNDLMTIPENQRCTVEEVPTYLRASIPLGVMNTAAPFSRGNASKLLISPVDDSDPARMRDHLREQNYGFIRSITFHEIYPGHHLQSVLHKRADGLIRKKFRSPLFVEGWGLYTEDLMQETGFLHSDRLKFFGARNALWRALRIIIDMGLGAGEMTPEEAVQLLMERVGQGEHMARGEVMRYTRMENATYQSCYMYGKTLIRQLREEYREMMGPDFSRRDFHDNLCAHGSPPVPLVREVLLSDGESAERSGV